MHIINKSNSKSIIYIWFIYSTCIYNNNNNHAHQTRKNSEFYSIKMHAGRPDSYRDIQICMTSHHLPCIFFFFFHIQNAHVYIYVQNVVYLCLWNIYLHIHICFNYKLQQREMITFYSKMIMNEFRKTFTYVYT